VSPSSVQSSQSPLEHDSSRLYISFQASSLSQAEGLAAELHAIAPDVALSPARSQEPGRPDWTVALATPPLPLTLAFIREWEGEMLAVEGRWPGCQFLGWRTWPMPAAPLESRVKEPARDGSGAGRRRSQRELVTASLLRCPPGEPRGIARSRFVRH
jgi:hypothetical protein